MSILHKDHKTDESEIKFKFLSDSVLKAFEKDIGILDFRFAIGRNCELRSGPSVISENPKSKIRNPRCVGSSRQ